MDITEIPTHELKWDRATAESDKRIVAKLLLFCGDDAERNELAARIICDARVILAIDAELAQRGEADA